jgi:glycosyltransferase involved in cell wall biosynthesis
MELTQPATVADAQEDPADGGIAIVVLTHNRAHLVSKCVENVLLRTSDATREIVIWDNASTDGTAEYLATLTDPRIRVVRSEQNIGQNAYARAFRETTAPFLIEIDDDVTDAPEAWDRTMRDAYVALPQVGFLAADLEDDPNDQASRVRHHVRPHEYERVTENGVNLLTGPAGGGCAITSRWLNQLAGGFKESKTEVFWLEDARYIGDIHALGYRSAVMADLRVHHTGGPYYSSIPKEKAEYWRKYWARKRRRTAVKKVLVKVPGVRRLNARFGWFEAPA